MTDTSRMPWTVDEVVGVYSCPPEEAQRALELCARHGVCPREAMAILATLDHQAAQAASRQETEQ